MLLIRVRYGLFIWMGLIILMELPLSHGHRLSFLSDVVSDWVEANFFIRCSLHSVEILKSAWFCIPDFLFILLSFVPEEFHLNLWRSFIAEVIHQSQIFYYEGHFTAHLHFGLIVEL